jgi:pyridoxal biosynthesis lyase PdxS
MFDISSINTRYFEIKLNDLVLEVEPPKVKTLKKVAALSKVKDEEAVDDLSEAVSMILSKNKVGKKVSAEIIDELDLDQLVEILTAFFSWLNNEKNSKN